MRDEIEVNVISGQGKGSFNGKYLIDAFEAITGEQIEFRIPKGRDMAVIRDVDNETYFSIVMGLKN
jgi:DNA polymerase III sliding clamp (beta) subunit (PCNA family)